MIEDRPILAAFGNTADKTFPLILVLGREYNGEGTVSTRVGKYDFTVSPRATFWNRAYSFLERNCFPGGDFKNHCIRIGLSPVIFSNVLPNPIPNNVSEREKMALRRSISEAELSRHLSSLFSLSLMGRVQVVILSVGENAEFTYSIECVRKYCRVANLMLVELPYLGSRRPDCAFDKVVGWFEHQKLCQVLALFLEMHNRAL